jgi:hypothetical protein
VKALSVNSSTEKKKKSSFQSQHIARLCNWIVLVNRRKKFFLSSCYYIFVRL